MYKIYCVIEIMLYICIINIVNKSNYNEYEQNSIIVNTIIFIFLYAKRKSKNAKNDRQSNVHICIGFNSQTW